MFYLLNFENHEFISCNSVDVVEKRINSLLNSGVPIDSIEIINGFLEDARLDFNQFQKFCEIYNMGVTRDGVEEDSAKMFSVASEAKEEGKFVPMINMRSGTSKIDERLDALSNYRKNEELMTRVAQEQKQNKIAFLISKIKALEPRISDLIATGNACLQSNIPLTGQAFGMRENYDTNQFFTNSWSHLVGFVGNPHSKSCHIEFLGITAGGACGVYDFRTDGVRVFSINENKPFDVITPNIEYMEKFLNNFDVFESSFYAYVDKTIEKQNKSVDKLIAAAQEKVSKKNNFSKRDLKEIEH